MRALALAGLLTLATFAPMTPSAAAPCSGGPDNDCLDDAIEWFGKPETFSNAGATVETGEPLACDGKTVARSVWFHVEVVEPGSADSLGVTLEETHFYATLGLYEKDANGALVLIDCEVSWYDEGLHAPTALAPCAPGKKYWIQVGGQGPGESGSFKLAEFSSFWRDECWFKPTLPTEPRQYAPSGGNGKIVVSWVEPWWDGGRSVSLTHYKVYRADSCAGPFRHVGSPTSRSYSDTGLPPGTTFCYEVTAVNSVGEGPAEPGRSGTTWPLPRPPHSLAIARGGDGELKLSWEPSPDQGGPAPMVEHRIYRSASAEGPFVRIGKAGATATTYTDTGLGKGVTMHYVVSAVNEVGEGAQSGSASGTTWQIPGIPRDVRIRATPISGPPVTFEVSWTAPADPAPFTHYRVYRSSSPDGKAELIGEVTQARTRILDGGRLPFADYTYEVRAKNPAGEGDASVRACYAYPLESPLGRCR